MGTSRRTRLIRGLVVVAVVGAAIGLAVVAADERSEDAIDVPAGGIPEPRPQLELVVDEPTAGERAPRGLLWVLCCGAWRSPEAHGLDVDRRADRASLGALEWTRRGYAAATFAARSGAGAVDEAVAAYDRLHEEHPGLSICAFGASAAGHMALMVAARRPELECVVAHSSPSALADLPDEPIPGILSQSPLSLAVEVFGRDRLEELSPLRHAADIRAEVRLVTCSDDRIIPPSQSRRLARALRRGRAARVELDVIRGESVRRGQRPPRGHVHVIHECFASAERFEADRAGTVEFVKRALAEG